MSLSVPFNPTLKGFLVQYQLRPACGAQDFVHLLNKIVDHISFRPWDLDFILRAHNSLVQLFQSDLLTHHFFRPAPAFLRIFNLLSPYLRKWLYSWLFLRVTIVVYVWRGRLLSDFDSRGQVLESDPIIEVFLALEGLSIFHSVIFDFCHLVAVPIDLKGVGGLRYVVDGL